MRVTFALWPDTQFPVTATEYRQALDTLPFGKRLPCAVYLIDPGDDPTFIRRAGRVKHGKHRDPEHHFRGVTKMVPLGCVAERPVHDRISPHVTSEVGPNSDSDLAFAQLAGIPHCVNHRLPHPRVIAARTALAVRSPAPLERVLRQIEAAREFIADWRDKGRPDLPNFLRPPFLQ